MPTSCALFGGFSIGARVALLWQHKRTRNVSEYSEYMLSCNSQTGSTNTSKRKKEKRNYLSTDLRQRSHPFYCTICTYATQYIVGGIEFLSKIYVSVWQ